MAVRHGKILSQLTVFAILLSFLTGVSSAMTLAAAGPLRPAPDFSLTDLAGQTVDLSLLRGRNTLLLFGATWCPHCRTALETLKDIHEAVGDQLAVSFVAVGQSAAEVMDFFGDRIPPYSILPDPNGEVGTRYAIKRIPVCIFIDETGLIQYVGIFNEMIVWRLLAGEQIYYPDTPYDNLQACDRLAAQTPDEPSPKLKRYIVELDEKPEFSKRLSKTALKSQQTFFHRAAQRIGGRIIHNYGRLKNKIVVEISPDRAERLKELPRFKSFKEDRRVHALLEDSAYQIKADYAWDNAITGQGVKVCVVDTGIDYTHPDLLNKVIAQYDATMETEDAMDDNGHGTHCAGIIASEGLQYRGVSHDVSLLAAKVLDYTGNGYSSDVILGINWCIDQGADVISLSLGEGLFSGTCDSDEMAQAVNAAVDAGVVVACAAGNDGDLTRMVSPACASKVIAVGAVDKVDNIASYSDGGAELDVVAPGGDQLGGKDFPEIVSTYSTEVANNPLYCLYLITDECWDEYFVVDGTRYIRAVGTSMATPHVAAAAALLLEANPGLTPAQVKTVLEQNADDLGTPGWDNAYGWGRINIQKALENIPPEAGELAVRITEPNASDSFMVNEQFGLAAEVDCFGGDGCGSVLLHAQLCSGRDCNDFIDINSLTTISTLDNNPNNLGVLSGYTVDTEVPVIFDAQTVFDISENAYAKSINPITSLVGSTMPGEYNTGDLEPADGVGAIGEDVAVQYGFDLPPGKIKIVKVRMENYIVVHQVYPPFAGWYVYTSNTAGDNLHLVGDCIPPEGGGGETPSPDCWFISSDPNTLADLNPGGTNYIKLVSHDVDDDGFGQDFLTFNDIEVIVEYEPDPNNDEVYKYYVKFDINDIDASAELTAARLKINITQPAADSVGELRLVDNALLASDSAQALHEASDPCYMTLANPIKTFSCKNAGTVSLNVKAAVEQALLAGQDSIAFQITEYDNDQLVALSAGSSDNPPILTISQKVTQAPGPPDPNSAGDPNSGPRNLNYDTVIVRDISQDTYTRDNNPASAVIGAPFSPQYNTGDLEPNDGVGAIGEDVAVRYGFELPSGSIKMLKVRMENYIVVHQVYPPFAGWYVYTSNIAGDNLRLVGDCIPPEGGGGEAPSPDCWFISSDPNVLADLNPGGTNYIKLVSHDVDDDGFGQDFLTFNDIEVIVEYEIDPNNDHISRYYVKFDISDLRADTQVDSATLNLYVTEPAADSVAEISIVNGTYNTTTSPYTIYEAEDAYYSTLTNPIKSFACDTTGLRKINVKAVLEDAIENGVAEIAFLINEQGEDALFTVDAGAGANPPRLDVYLKSGLSSGRAGWLLLPNDDGNFKLRVLANNDVGLVALSDTVVINIYDPNLPVIHGVDCMINSAWQDCKTAKYGDALQKIRIDATDPQGTPDVWLTLTNVPDSNNFVDEPLAYSGGYFTKDTNPSFKISDSGQWQIVVTARDSDGNTDTKTIIWNIPWGALDAYLISPTGDITIPKSSSFNVQAGVHCLDAECPRVNLSLNLNQPYDLIYDDASAEDYGDIGSTSGFLAAKFKPAAYPAQLKTARFYVWDQTTYPFELRVWNDKGNDWLGVPGAPGAQLMSPLTVDPVAPSVALPGHEVAWFDVDLSARNIVINSGEFYIGFRQIEQGKLNQVGFDMRGASYHPYARSWGFLPEWGWFNLDYWCDYVPDYCGNLMIRAMMSEPGAYSGQLPKTVGPAILYTTDNHPKPCPNTDMDPGQSCQVTLTVHAVGAPGQSTKFHAVSANNYSLDNAGPVKVTISNPLTPCSAANLNAVGLVDFEDFAVLADQWLATAPPLSADIHIDGAIDAEDLARLADYWLTSCE